MPDSVLRRLPPWQRLITTCLSLAICMLVVAAALFTGANAYARSDYLQADEAFALSAPTVDAAGNVTLAWTIAPGYYLYRDRIAVKASPEGTKVALDLPDGKLKDDPNFGEMVVYYQSVAVSVHAPGAVALDITWQGCADEGLCYPPQQRHVTLLDMATGTSHASHQVPTATRDLTDSKNTLLNGNDSQISQFIGQRSLAWTIPLFFLFGIALAFTPCVLPMVPIVSSIVVGSQATPRRALMLSLAFVLPMALTYAALGAIAAVAGANLQALLQNPWTLGLFGAVFVVLAMAMFGFFTLQLPAFIRERLDGASRNRQGGTLVGAAIMGLLSALLVGPCMTAPLAGILLYIAQSGNVVSGALLLFALGIGMGVPLLAIGTLGARFMPRPGPWMELVKGTFGFLLLGTAVWMIERIVSAQVALALWGMLLAGVAMTLKHISATTQPAYRLLLTTTALIMGLWGAASVLGAAMGNGDIMRPLALPALTGANHDSARQVVDFEVIHSKAELADHLQAATLAGIPLIVDFSADWCVSCKKMERAVYPLPAVQQALSGVKRLRADVTDNTPDEVALMREYQVLGPPTILLFNTLGDEVRDARIVGEFTGTELIKQLNAVTASVRPAAQTGYNAL